MTHAQNTAAGLVFAAATALVVAAASDHSQPATAPMSVGVVLPADPADSTRIVPAGPIGVMTTHRHAR